MRNFCGLIVAVLLTLVAGVQPARAQFKNGSQATELNLPRLSQRAQITQRVGLTDITVVYHAPLAGGREVVGETVPYGQVWGAPARTKIQHSLSPMMSASKAIRLPQVVTGCR